MKIAVMTNGEKENRVVADAYKEAQQVLIYEADTKQLLKEAEMKPGKECEAAKLIVDEDCEAVLCGPIEEAPFVIIADEGCVTRYQAAGLSPLEAIEKMEQYELDMITDFIGGTGCHSGEECDHRHGDDDE